MADTSTITETTAPAPSPSATSTATADSGKTPTVGSRDLPRSDLAAEIAKQFDAAAAKVKANAPTDAAAPARGPDGKFLPKAEQQNTQAATPVETQAAKPVVAPRDAEATGREERALTALRRAKVPKSILDGLDHDTRIQWGSDLAEEQKRTDKLLRDPTARAETRQDPKAGTPAQADPASGTPQVTADLSALSIKLAESLALDEAGQKQLEAYGAALRAPLLQEVQAVKAGAAEAQQSADAVMEMVAQMLARNSRATLKDEIPELGDPAIWSRVTERMERLFDSGGYEDIEDPQERMTECLRDASAIECRDSIQERAREATINRNGRRAASQPDINTRRSDTGGGVGDTPFDYAWALLSKKMPAREVQALVDQRFR